MSQIEKLVAKLKARPPEASVGDVKKVLEAYGWELRSQNSSHMSYRKPGDPFLLTIATVSGKRVKTTYIDKVCEHLGLDD